MKIAFVGKGGSGKTTLTSLLVRYLADLGRPLLAVDADINQHLVQALDASVEPESLPTLGEHLGAIKRYLRGDNPRIRDEASMTKTTPAGTGSRLLRIGEPNPIWDACVRTAGGVRLAVTGPFTEADLGVACYHSKVGAVELLLNHLVDFAEEYFIVDMTAGADSFASGLFTRFDVTFLVCEPTLRSIGVYRQYAEYAKEFGVRIAVIGNKIADEDDLTFLRDQLGTDLYAWIGRSQLVRAAERGEIRPIGELEPDNLKTLAAMVDLVDRTPQDWARFQRQAEDFHRRNALAWANERAGTDLTEQIDEGFVMGPAALERLAIRS